MACGRTTLLCQIGIQNEYCAGAPLSTATATARLYPVASYSVASTTMQPGASIDPVWLLMSSFTALETLVTLVLVMPMPSNKVRGNLVNTIAEVWHKSEYIKRTAWVLVALNCYYLWECARSIFSYNEVYAASCESRAMVLYLQRNTFISALSILMFLVMRRLLDIQQQLFQTRALVKEAMGAVGSSAVVSPRASGSLEPSALPAHPLNGPPAVEAGQRRSVRDMLRQLDHSVSNALGQEAGHGTSAARKQQ